MVCSLTNKQIEDLRWSNTLFGSGISPICNWYGIKGIKYMYLNYWCDPLIEYKGRRCSCYIVEDTMWEEWIHDDDWNLLPEREKDFDGFSKYMFEHRDEVIELCERVLFAEEVR